MNMILETIWDNNIFDTEQQTIVWDRLGNFEYVPGTDREVFWFTELSNKYNEYDLHYITIIIGYHEYREDNHGHYYNQKHTVTLLVVVTTTNTRM